MPGMVQAFCLKRNCTGWLTPAVTARFGLLCSTGAVDATACSSAAEQRSQGSAAFGWRSPRFPGLEAGDPARIAGPGNGRNPTLRGKQIADLRSAFCWLPPSVLLIWGRRTAGLVSRSRCKRTLGPGWRSSQPLARRLGLLLGGLSAMRYEVFHYRDRNGSGVDLVIETPKGVIAVEGRLAGDRLEALPVSSLWTHDA